MGAVALLLFVPVLFIWFTPSKQFVMLQKCTIGGTLCKDPCMTLQRPRKGGLFYDFIGCNVGFGYVIVNAPKPFAFVAYAC